MRQLHRQQGVTGLVNRRDALLALADDHRAALGAHQHLVFRKLEVEHANDLLVVARRVEGRFVHQVRQIGTREARCSARQHRHVHVVGERNLLRVNREDALAALHVRTIDDDAAIEASGPQQRRVEHVRAGWSPPRE